MCERRDSIAAVSAAADQLAETCEAELRAAPSPSAIDRAHPTRAGVTKALRAALRELAATPADMALQLGKIK